jgi:SAM-dependent methyltransferase
VSRDNFPDAAETWNKRYDQSGFLFGTEPNAYLASHLELFIAGKSALAVADGEGRNSVWLARQGLNVDAFDISPVGVEKAKDLAKASGVAVNFNVCDCDSWAWKPHAYDYVIAIFVQFADPDMRQRLFANMIKTLKPGGVLILQGYTPKQLDYKTGGPPCADHLYTDSLLQSAFRDLEIIELRSYEAEITEGEQHRGLSALIGMVARKPSGVYKR